MVFQSKFSVDIPDSVPLHQYVLAKADEYGDSVAVVDGPSGFSITYKQLKNMVFAISKNIAEKFDSKKGDVFGILLPNHPLYPAYFHGLIAAGATVTTINPLYTENELRKQLQDSGARFLLTIPLFFEKAEAAVKDTNVKHIFLLSTTPDLPQKKDETSDVTVLNGNVLLAPPSDLTPLNIAFNPKEDIAILPYSSGTTGVNKGVCLTHHNIISNLAQIDSVENYTRDDVLIGILPMFHIYGMVLILNMSLCKGAKVVTVPKFDFGEFLQLIQKYKLTVLHLVPPIILALAKQPVVANFDLTSVKFIVSGAAPLAPTLQEELKQKYNIIAKQGYGLTEASPVLCVNPSDDNRYGSSGILLANTELKVANIENGEELEEGQEGELCFRGPQVMKGYLNNEEATNNTIKNGWLHTGDIGYIKDGYIYITDRLKELIKFKGYQVPPAELEALLLKHEKIVDAAVIGIPDEDAGELPKGFIVKRKDVELSEEEVMTYIADQVAPYKKLRFVEFIDEIPKSSAGKILRRVLKDKEIAKQQQ